MLKIDNLHFRYSQLGVPVLNGASLELNQGEIGILLGKNGSGKTTLFKNILGIEKPQSGVIRFDGEDLLKMKRKDRARRIAYVPQHIHFGDLSVFDSVLMGRVSYFGMKAGRENYEAVERSLPICSFSASQTAAPKPSPAAKSKKSPLPALWLRSRS